MAAPTTNITWGDIVGDYGRIGIHCTTSNTNTETTVTVQVWFWSKYSVADNMGNALYLDDLSASGSATTNKGSTNIQTTVETGSGWSTSNQVLLTGQSYTYTHARGTSASTRYIYAKLTNVDRVGGTMYANTTVTIPALTSYTVSYNANGGSGAPSSQTKYYGKSLTLSGIKPTRTGYTFKEWNTKSDGSGTTYAPSGSYTSNAAATLYAIWNENYLTVNYYSNFATESFSGALNAVGADKNVIVRTSNYYYDNDYSTNGHWDYSFKDSSTYLGRTGYTATGYWGTSPNGGTLVKQSDPYISGQAMAEAVGKSLKNGNATINLYAQWQINYHNISYNANGGTGSMDSQSIAWGATFNMLNNSFSREGYKFVGWNLYRNSDNKWYALSHDWFTESELIANDDSKFLYKDGQELILGQSWIRGNATARDFTFYAIWEISGVVYMRNQSAVEPYIVGVFNGVGWDLYIAGIYNGINWDIIS